MHRKALASAAVFFALSTLAARADTPVKCNFKTLAACPKIGCSKPGSPLAVTNSQKRKTTIHGSPSEIGFSELRNLQAGVEAKFANGPIVINGAKISSYHNLKAAPRKIVLSGLQAGGGIFSERDFVELFGFIAVTKLAPHPNTGETVNCKLKDEPSNDLHINITPAKNGDETEGVVAEMIPQNPNRKNQAWSLAKLKKLQAQQLPVRVQGRLFFDSEHKPNTKKTGTAGGNPRRFSLWEVHPISAFFVCPAASCTGSSGWTALEDWNPSP